MGLDRCYCPGFAIDAACHLDGDEARHLARVRRVAVGAEVVALGRDRVDLRPARAVPPRPPGRVMLTLATAIPKGNRFDWLVEKATELGVERLTPLVTERSTVDPRSAKLDRLRRAIVESCKQCRRDRLMALDEPIRWDRWLAQLDPLDDHRWVAHPGGTPPELAPSIGRGGRVVAAVGPEGGFTDAELDLARRAGFERVDLTPTILRIETAGVALAARLLL